MNCDFDGELFHPKEKINASVGVYNTVSTASLEKMQWIPDQERKNR